MGRVSALKFIAPAYLARPNAVPRFLREMRLVGRLSHPNIVQAHDADQVNGVPYIVMEYVPGQDLERLLQGRGPLPPEDVVRHAIQVALGLAHAHERGVIHRDIKPSNLLLGEDGRLRILDLGLGTLMDDRDPDRGSVATCDGMAIGTADYMSPEQAVGHNAPDGRSDLYSLGCVMYYLLTGRVPFPADSQIECIASRIKGRPIALGDLRPGLPRGVVGIVERLMANRPDERYPSAAAVAEALQALGGECEPSLSERRAHQVEHPGTASLGSVDSESSLPNELSTTDSTNIAKAPLCWWLSFLWYLSGWSQRFAVLILSAAFLASLIVLLAAFGAGFLLAGLPH
jgi:serine/threonine protein kinase